MYSMPHNGAYASVIKFLEKSIIECHTDIVDFGFLINGTKVVSGFALFAALVWLIHTCRFMTQLTSILTKCRCEHIMELFLIGIHDC